MRPRVCARGLGRSLILEKCLCVAPFHIVEPRIMLAEGAVELTQVRLDPVHARLQPVHAASQATIQAINRTLVEEYPNQNRQCWQSERDIELHVVHTLSVPPNRYCVQAQGYSGSVRRTKTAQSRSFGPFYFLFPSPLFC